MKSYPTSTFEERANTEGVESWKETGRFCLKCDLLNKYLHCIHPFLSTFVLIDVLRLKFETQNNRSICYNMFILSVSPSVDTTRKYVSPDLLLKKADLHFYFFKLLY